MKTIKEDFSLFCIDIVSKKRESVLPSNIVMTLSLSPTPDLTTLPEAYSLSICSFADFLEDPHAGLTHSRKV